MSSCRRLELREDREAISRAWLADISIEVEKFDMRCELRAWNGVQPPRRELRTGTLMDQKVSIKTGQPDYVTMTISALYLSSCLLHLTTLQICKMYALPLVLLGLVSPLTSALPTPAEHAISQRDTASWTWDQGATPEYTIHVSCNATERSQLQRALNESITLAQHAKDHIMRFGNSSETFVKYFGNSSTTAEPAGWYDKVISGDRKDVIFRCDDVDNKCYQDGMCIVLRSNIPTDTL